MNPTRKLKAWNDRLHTYAGLFLLLFLWLFAVSGFVMNHPRWFGHEPQRTRARHRVEVPRGLDDQATAEALLGPLGLVGEIVVSPPRRGHLGFRVLRPGSRSTVDVDLRRGVAVVDTATPDLGGVLADLHTATGVRSILREPEPRRDWWMTRLWSAAIDGVSIGLIFLVVSALVMWLGRPAKLRIGLVALTVGTVSCAFFIWGLDWLSG